MADNSFSIAERAIHKVGEMSNPFLGKFRQRKLNNLDFTVISNNCWAGICYEYYNLPKNSPTVGLYFFADEYIRFISDIERYVSVPLEVIPAGESKYREELVRRNQTNVLVGRLDDVEMTLLHYHDRDVALAKWNRRVKRINWDNLIYKFSYMNLCTEGHIAQFERIMAEKRERLGADQNLRSLVFVPDAGFKYEDAHVVRPGSDGQIANDTFYWNRYCDVPGIINIP